MRVECIDYQQLPDLNPLLSEYLYHYDKVESLYDCPVHLSLEGLKKRADSVLRNPPSFPRDQLVELTLEFNQRVGPARKLSRISKS